MGTKRRYCKTDQTGEITKAFRRRVENESQKIEDRVKAILKRNKDLTDNKCGVTLPTVINESGFDRDSVKKALRKLKDEKKIIVRMGINGHLILLK